MWFVSLLPYFLSSRSFCICRICSWNNSLNYYFYWPILTYLIDYLLPSEFSTNLFYSFLSCNKYLRRSVTASAVTVSDAFRTCWLEINTLIFSASFTKNPELELQRRWIVVKVDRLIHKRHDSAHVSIDPTVSITLLMRLRHSLSFQRRLGISFSRKKRRAHNWKWQTVSASD